jgi:hypothetical protein
MVVLLSSFFLTNWIALEEAGLKCEQEPNRREPPKTETGEHRSPELEAEET